MYPMSIHAAGREPRLDASQRALALETELLQQKEEPSVRKKYLTPPDTPLDHKNIRFYVHKKRREEFPNHR